MAKKVLVPIADGSEELEALTIIDVLRRAGAEVTIASVGGREITASRKTKIVADAVIGDCQKQVYDLIALPGGMPGAENLRNNGVLTKMLKEQKDANRLFAAICAAPAVVLEHHGLIDNYRATCHPSFMPKLLRCKAVNDRVVVDKNCITSQGVGTGMEFSLKLVEAMFGKEKAATLASDMLVAR